MEKLEIAHLVISTFVQFCLFVMLTQWLEALNESNVVFVNSDRVYLRICLYDLNLPNIDECNGGFTIAITMFTVIILMVFSNVRAKVAKKE